MRPGFDFPASTYAGFGAGSWVGSLFVSRHPFGYGPEDAGGRPRNGIPGPGPPPLPAGLMASETVRERRSREVVDRPKE
jgi:hypothetical protein